MSKIFLSVPILEKADTKMWFSMYQAIHTCREHQVRLYLNENDSLISRVRNCHISLFLNEYTDFDYFMSWDSDIEAINCYPTNNIFSKLISHDKDFVGGLYALKSVGQPRCSSIALDKRPEIKFDSGLVEMLWLSSGCWCVKRSVIEKMVAAYPDLTYDGDDNMTGKKVHGLYVPMIAELEDNKYKFKKYLSEDWSFCKRWRDIGGKIHSDTSIVLAHHGHIPYLLWKVEVVAKKRDIPTIDQPSILPPPSMKLMKENSNKPFIIPPPPPPINQIKEGIEILKGIPNPAGADLPPIGWDLKKE